MATEYYDALLDIASAGDVDGELTPGQKVADVALNWLSQWYNGGPAQWLESGFAHEGDRMAAYLELADLPDVAGWVRAVVEIGVFDFDLESEDYHRAQEDGASFNTGYHEWAVELDQAAHYTEFLRRAPEIEEALAKLAVALRYRDLGKED